jgi:hypothetical protein
MSGCDQAVQVISKLYHRDQARGAEYKEKGCRYHTI